MTSLLELQERARPYANGFDALPRHIRRDALARAAKARKAGAWGAWELVRFRAGTVAKEGWPADFERAHRNAVFSVLDRTLPDGTRHLAISSLSGERPSWREAQRIKNELAGPDATAVEVYPPEAEVVDAAPMYHLWVLPAPLPFSLHWIASPTPARDGGS